MKAKCVLEMSTRDYPSGFEGDFDTIAVDDNYIDYVKKEGIDWLSDFLGEDFDDERIIDIVEDESPEDTLLSVKIYRLDEDGEKEGEPVFEASKWLSEAAREYYDENKLCDVELVEKPATRRALNGIYYNLSGYCWCGEEQALLKISEGYYDKYYCLRDDEHYKKIIKNKGYGTLYLDRYCNDKLISREMLFTMD